MLNAMLPFWISIGLLSLAQGAIVALPGVLRASRLADVGGRVWAAVPPLSVIVFVVVAGAAERASAQGLTYLALVAVPLLAVLALGWLSAGARPVCALLVPALFALAWADRSGLAGEAAALALSALSCVALGVLLAAVTPPRWLAAGIVTMAVADTVLVIAALLQRPNDALNAAHPAAGLPRLQSATLGAAVMGYGDLFAAAALGALLALAAGRGTQLRAGVLCAAIAAGLDLLFLLVDELPATVPVALTLIVVTVVRRRRSSPSGPAQAPAGFAAPRPARARRLRDRAPRDRAAP